MANHLVMSGGAGLGSALTGYANACIEAGISFDTVRGVSVGNLVGYRMACEQYDEMNTDWENISFDQVFTKRTGIGSLISMAWGGRVSFYDMDPLLEFLSNRVEVGNLKKQCSSGITDLITGRYAEAHLNAHKTDSHLITTMAESCCIPIMCKPFTDSEGSMWVDGGLRNQTPLLNAMRNAQDGDTIHLMLCKPRHTIATVQRSALNRVWKIALRTVDILCDEIMNGDLDGLLRINRLVGQAQKQGVVLLKENGDPYRYVNVLIYEPPELLGDSMDFTSATAKKRIAICEQVGRDVLKAA